MIDYVYQVWCEYDIGQEGAVYETETLAWKSAADMLRLQDIDPEDARIDGLVGVETVEFVREEKQGAQPAYSPVVAQGSLFDWESTEFIRYGTGQQYSDEASGD
jgi:hypothetical protein